MPEEEDVRKLEDELTRLLPELQEREASEPGISLPITSLKLSTRATILLASYTKKLAEATKNLERSSKALERLTQILIRLTFVLLLIGGLGLLEQSLTPLGVPLYWFWLFFLVGAVMIAYLVFIAFFRIKSILGEVNHGGHAA